MQATGLKELEKKLLRCAERAGNIQPHAKTEAQIIEAQIQRTFESSPATTQTGMVYGGVQWQRLSEAYLKARPERRSGRQLIDTEETRNSFRLGSPGNIFATTRNSVEFGSKNPKAFYNQFRRQMAFPHQAMIDEVTKAREKYIIGDLAD